MDNFDGHLGVLAFLIKGLVIYFDIYTGIINIKDCSIKFIDT